MASGADVMESENRIFSAQALERKDFFFDLFLRSALAARLPLRFRALPALFVEKSGSASAGSLTEILRRDIVSVCP